MDVAENSDTTSLIKSLCNSILIYELNEFYIAYNSYPIIIFISISRYFQQYTSIDEKSMTESSSKILPSFQVHTQKHTMEKKN